ncbi:MAG: Chaperone protein DnaK [Nitrospira sp.]|jgi:molecular chaperone DnaK|nr:Chaperone protein DnaK [Nitrospira sp.]
MKRTTIDFGIDLGTTNSSIAERSEGKLNVFKNNEDQESTPSAVYIDRNNHLIVGRLAKERVESDPDNAFQEFKRQMGSGFEYVFQRSGRRMKPEELSAEVLKTLLACVQQWTGHRPDAAVITVPAAFGLDQCNATKRAAELAGLRETALLTEPVAAALAYGFLNERDRVHWLVYDFGGEHLMPP